MGKYDVLLDEDRPQAGGAGSSAPKKRKYGDLLDGGPSSGPQEPQVDYVISEDRAAPAGTTAVASFSEDPEARLSYYAKQRGLPESAYRIHNGEVYYQGADKNWYREKGPGVMSGAASGIGEALPAIGSLAGTVLGAGGGAIAGGPAAPVAAAAGGLAGGGLGTAAGDQLRQLIAQGTSGQEPKFSRTSREVAFDLAGGVVGGLAAKGVNKMAASKAGRIFTDNITKGTSRALAEALRFIERETGQRITLTPAELTGSQVLGQEQRLISNLPSGAEVFDPFLTKRAGQLEETVETLTRKQFGENYGAEPAREMFSSHANAVLDGLMETRQAHAKVLYRRSFVAANPVDLTDFYGVLKKEYADGDLAVRKRLKKVQKFLATVEDRTDLEELHYKVRVGLSDEFTNLKTKEKKKNADRVMRGILGELDNAMDMASPGYADARALYSDQSGSIRHMLEGVIGKAAKGGEGIKLLTKTGPRELASMRRSFLRVPGGEKVWNAQIRSLIADTYEEAGRVYFSNIASPQRLKASQASRFFATVWGSPTQRSRWRAAMSADQYKAMSTMMAVLESTGRALHFNTETAMLQKAIKQLETGIGPGTAARVSQGASPFTLVDNISDFFAEKKYAAKVKRIAEVLTNPQALDIINRAEKAAGRRMAVMPIIGKMLGQGPLEETVENLLGLEGRREVRPRR